VGWVGFRIVQESWATKKIMCNTIEANKPSSFLWLLGELVELLQRLPGILRVKSVHDSK